MGRVFGAPALFLAASWAPDYSLQNKGEPILAISAENVICHSFQQRFSSSDSLGWPPKEKMHITPQQMFAAYVDPCLYSTSTVYENIE